MAQSKSKGQEKNRNGIQELRLPALEVRQGPKRRLYSFAIDGKRLESFVTVSRVKRSADGDILGYQRPEVISHIAEIRDYLESEDPMIPNALVVAFDDRVQFKPLGADNLQNGASTQLGELVIPVDPTWDDPDRPGWVVDGQQRLAAIREAQIDSFPICVVAFIAADNVEQREQFILVNSTKPLPKSLIYELLPTTQAQLPSLLQRRRFPALLLARLNTDEDSPLKGMIRTPTCPEGIIKDNSLLRLLENSLSDGVLYRLRDSREDGTEKMLRVVKVFWAAVVDTFKDAWGLPPKRSRLMHGAGVVSMGFLMDAIADRHRAKGSPDQRVFSADLAPLKEVCRWTDGYWDFGPGKQRKWNEIQNTSKDIQLLANYLLMQYKSRVWSSSSPECQ